MARQDLFNVETKWLPITTIQSTAHVVHCHVTTVVYGYDEPEEKQDLWEAFTDIEGNPSAPWVVMGDFNHLSDIDDRIGGLPATHAHIMDFQFNIGMQIWRGEAADMLGQINKSMALVSFLSYIEYLLIQVGLDCSRMLRLSSWLMIHCTICLVQLSSLKCQFWLSSLQILWYVED